MKRSIVVRFNRYNHTPSHFEESINSRLKALPGRVLWFKLHESSAGLVVASLLVDTDINSPTFVRVLDFMAPAATEAVINVELDKLIEEDNMRLNCLEILCLSESSRVLVAIVVEDVVEAEIEDGDVKGKKEKAKKPKRNNMP